MSESLADTWKRVRRALGLVGLLFAVCLTLSFLGIRNVSGWAQILTAFLGIWLCIRWLRFLTRRAIWRLRNRLLVTYLFIAVVPLMLVVMLVGLGSYAVASQVVFSFMTSELGRRIDMLNATAERLVVLQPDQRRYAVEHMLDLMYKERFQGIQVVIREGGKIYKYPDDESIQPPPDGWKDVSGIAYRDGRFYGWAHRITSTGDITACAPLSEAVLSSLLPDLGVANLFYRSGVKGVLDFNSTGTESLKPAAFALDLPVNWISPMPVFRWETPGDGSSPSRTDQALFQVRSRPSMIFDVLFLRKTNDPAEYVPGILLGISTLFLIVELVALVIGVSMTRTITNAVHKLYEGTERVMQGDFTHRIDVVGKDQLADLGYSFNRMTENVEQLLAISKEKERLQSELEIASEVQNQLYPKSAPDIRGLKLRALVKPARMVSGDYYDYVVIDDHRLAVAVGDVAGKGISAALLMATLQSAVRTHLSFSREAAAHGDVNAPCLSASVLVSHLNEQIYNTTSPEKYATFFLGLFDSTTSQLKYTNGGHLPPMLFRNGAVTYLEIDGTVVGAFPQADYGESQLDLVPGDLLLWYTDGITEPENAYGEMFGDQRLIETVQRNINRSEEQILQSVVDAVLAWTGAGELQDDMTLVVARCVAD